MISYHAQTGIRVLAACTAAFGFGCATSARAATSADPAGARPNIIFILTDDQGYGDLGRNGNKVIKTPHLDQMYDRSVRFEDFQVSPTCAPTRSAIMTGRHEFKSGVTHTIYERERMSLDATTLAEVLKSAGYTTGIFGKWHLGDEEAYRPDRRGFDEVFIHGAGGIGQTYSGTCGDAPGNSYFDPVILHNGTFVKTSGYCTDVFFNQAAKWIDEKRGQEPFFCYISTNAPHTPLYVPEEYERMYRHLLKDAEGESNNADAKAQGKKKDPMADTVRFLGMVTNIDDNVGKLNSRLKAWGIERNTLVIFMNDNGGTAGYRIFNAGMKGTKGSAHNGGTRAMSLWQWPGTLEPAPVHKLAAHIDMFPTLAEIAGAKIAPEIAAKLEGYSLVPLLHHPDAAWHDERLLFTHVGRWAPGKTPNKYGECSVRWKQYLYFPKVDNSQLFDLKSDPGETTDIADRHPEIVEKLSAAYDQWWLEVLPGMVNEQAYKTAPKVNTFKELYWKQYQGPGPNNVSPEHVVEDPVR